jgi:hypothetical protein
MSRCRPGALPLLALAAVLILGAAGPLWAHPASSSAVESPTPIVAPEPDPAPSGIPVAPEPQSISWLLLPGALVAAIAAWRCRRVIVAPALVALLVVFTFEDALHSVHHGVDPGETADCVIAAASAHVPATTLDAVPTTDLVAPSGEDPRRELRQTNPPVRCPCPDQGRAPPA